MLQINNETNINNINYLRYMDEQENKNEKAKKSADIFADEYIHDRLLRKEIELGGKK